MPIFVTRQEKFTAGHRLYNPNYSDEKNRAIFGKCSNPSGHGHNYTIEVTVGGRIDTETGFVIDLKILASLIDKYILADVDHRNLNVDVPWMTSKIPTTEVMADTFWNRLEPHLPPDTLWRVVVKETDKNWAEKRRDP